MAKDSNKTTVRDPEKIFLVNKVAFLHKVSPRYVNYILAGMRNNDEIFMTYMDLQEGIKTLVEENELLLAVKKLVPLN